MRLNNGQNNYQLPFQRQDPKFDELMAHIAQKNEQRDAASQQQQNPLVIAHSLPNANAPGQLPNSGPPNPFRDNDPLPAQTSSLPTNVPTFTSLPSNLPSNLSSLPQVNHMAQSQHTGKAIYANGGPSAGNNFETGNAGITGGQQFGAVKMNTTSAMRMTAARRPG